MDKGSQGFNIKLIVLGDSGVGKSTLVMRYNSPEGELPRGRDSTIGLDFFSKECEDKHLGKYRMDVWDTAGQETHGGLVNTYFDKVSGVLMVFDLDNPDSFDRIEYWRTLLKDEKLGYEPPIVLIGNKADLLDQSFEQDRDSKYEDYARSLNWPYFEVSAKIGTKVQEAFQVIHYDILSMIKG